MATRSITLSDEEAEMISSLLGQELSDLRMEIADTDSSRYKEGLHERRHQLEALLAKLSSTAAKP